MALNGKGNRRRRTRKDLWGATRSHIIREINVRDNIQTFRKLLARKKIRALLLSLPYAECVNKFFGLVFLFFSCWDSDLCVTATGGKKIIFHAIFPNSD